MKIGIIGYGSMGKMIFEKLLPAAKNGKFGLLVATRTREKLAGVQAEVCESNRELAARADWIFLCVPRENIKEVLDECKDGLTEEKLLISLNGSVLFEQMRQVAACKFAKVIPSVTAEVDRSQTLVSFDQRATAQEKEQLSKLLSCMGDVIELPEEEIGIGSELVSCMPAFLAAVVKELCASAKPHTTLPKEEILRMVLLTMQGTAALMLKQGYSCEEVIGRVATKGGITEVGTNVIGERFPAVADEVFEKTLERRKLTAEAAQKDFSA